MYVPSPSSALDLEESSFHLELGPCPQQQVTQLLGRHTCVGSSHCDQGEGAAWYAVEGVGALRQGGGIGSSQRV